MNRIEHQRPRGILTAVLCLSATVALVSGCTSSPGTARPAGVSESTAAVTSPVPSSTSSPTPTQTPTPTPTPAYTPASAEGPAENVPLPIMPEAAKVESKEGLEAFTRYWYELVNYGYETGDTEPVRAVTLPTSGIGNLYEIIGNGYMENDWIGRAHITIRSLESEYVLTVESRYQIVADIFQDPVDFYEPDGSFTTIHPRINPGRQLLEVAYTPDGWRLENIVTLKDESL